MRYTCALKQLRFHGYHGLYPEEALTGSDFFVDLSVTAEVDDDEIFAYLDSTINYETLYDLVKQVMQERENLIETLAARILEAVYAAYSHLTLVEVTIRKPNPGGLLKSGSAEVTLVR